MTRTSPGRAAPATPEISDADETRYSAARAEATNQRAAKRICRDQRYLCICVTQFCQVKYCATSNPFGWPLVTSPYCHYVPTCIRLHFNFVVSRFTGTASW